MILYFFYKNFVFTIPQFVFSFWCAFSGQTIYDAYYITFYNILFTSFPLVARALLDTDVNHIFDQKIKVSELFHMLYQVGQHNRIFNLRKLIVWFSFGLFHGLTVFLIPLYVSYKDVITFNGYTEDLWFVSVTSFTSIIIIVNMRLFLFQKYHTLANFLFLFICSFGLYFAYIWISNIIPDDVINLAIVLFSSPIFYLTVLLTSTFTFIIDYFERAYNYLIEAGSNEFCEVWATLPPEEVNFDENQKVLEKIYLEERLTYEQRNLDLNLQNSEQRDNPFIRN